LATISEALARQRSIRDSGSNVRVLVYPGTYRESLSLHGAAANEPALSIEATQPGVIISGSDVFTGWQALAGSPGVYYHNWPHNWGLVTIPNGWEPVNVQPIVRRSEMVFNDGNHLTQVLSLAELSAGEFFVDEAADRIYMQPSGGLGTVEVATRPRLVFFQSIRNVSVDGFIFEHAASGPLQGSAVTVNDSRSFRVANVEARWNNGFGVSVWNGENVTLRNIESVDNGGGGMGIGKSRLLRVENVDTSRNNWRGAQGDFKGWSVAGTKALALHDAHITGYRSMGNQTRGLWLDYDITRVLIENAVVCGNDHDGTFLEAAQGPLVIRDSVFCRNSGDGIHAGNLTQFALLDTAVCRNDDTVIFMGGLDARVVTDHETGEVISVPRGADWTLVGNVLRDGVRLFGAHSRPAVDVLAGTLVSDGNVWWHTSPEPFLIGGGETVDFAGWRQVTGQDINSVFTDSGVEC
jgi:hypothetical protein